MANLDFKLGEWFKQVDKKEKELKDKKNAQSNGVLPGLNVSEPVPMTNTLTYSDTPANVSPSIVATIDKYQPTPSQSQTRTEVKFVGSVGIIDDEEIDDIPCVEDFINFDEPEVKTFNYKTATTIIEDDRLSTLIEGTGAPKPIAKSIEHVVEKKAVLNEEAKPKSQAKVIPSEENNIQEKWNRMPHHLQVLFATSTEEIAQRSYKSFTEDRSQLISRLLDPSLSLEETARVLNVCPTTVRRYTNRGILPHFRTAGNQRRFRLSDVLAFIEKQGKSIH